MIPLRILHAVGAPDGWDGRSLDLLADDLDRDHHESARLVPLGMQADGERETFTVDHRPWRWWLGERRRLQRQLAAWTPDLLHLHGLRHLAPALDVARLLGLPAVVSVQGGEDADQLRRLRDPRVAWVTVPSAHHRARCIGEAGLSRDRVAIVPCGVPIPVVPAASDGDGWVLGGLLDGSDADLDLAARLATLVTEARREGSLVALRLHAPAARHRDLQELADRHPDAVQPPGPGQDFEAFLDGIDVLASVSRRGAHVLPLILALAKARPVLATAVGAAAEMVHDGESGVLVADAGAEPLAAAIRHLDLPSRRAVLARGARRQAEERFDIATVSRALVELYRQAIGNDGGGGGRRAEITTVYRRITERLR